jgi:hypothetical protein
VIVLEHPKHVTCLRCGATLHLVIVGVENLQMKTAEVPEAQRRKLIEVPASRLAAS